MVASDNLSRDQFREVRDPLYSGQPWQVNSKTKQRVRLDNVIATQPTYNPARVRAYAEGTATIDPAHSFKDVHVYRTGNNRTYVHEGHHRMIAAKQRGDTHIDAVVHRWKGPR